MQQSLEEQFQQRLSLLPAEKSHSAGSIVDVILEAARESRASDIHLVPEIGRLEMTWRLDGVLHRVYSFPPEIAGNIVSRLKVLAELLTYRTDVPQEGRIRTGDAELEMRVSTFPTMHGEKAVVRLFVGSGKYRVLSDLGLPTEIESSLDELLLESGGVILMAGPAGSGKTTTAYACLRVLVDKFGRRRSLVSLEDPIEAVVSGVSQSQVKPAAGFDYATGLRSLMRQDPEVILVGEIRDHETAETVFQASLTGHLVLTTFHAGSAAGAVSRLIDMGIEPYLLRSGILGILCQRLVRKLCGCSTVSEDIADRLGLQVATSRLPQGCERCGGTGYQGRIVLAELLLPDLAGLGRAILSRSDAAEIESLAVKSGMVSRWRRACEAVEQGVTSAQEVRRVLGFQQS